MLPTWVVESGAAEVMGPRGVRVVESGEAEIMGPRGVEGGSYLRPSARTEHEGVEELRVTVRREAADRVIGFKGRGGYSPRSSSINHGMRSRQAVR